MGQACSGSKTTGKSQDKTDKSKQSAPREVQLATRPVAVKASKQAAAAALITANNNSNNENQPSGTKSPKRRASGVLSVGQLMVQLAGGRKNASQNNRPHHDEITYNVEVLHPFHYKASSNTISF